MGGQIKSKDVPLSESPLHAKDDVEENISLSDIVGIAGEYRWLIFFIVIAFVFLAVGRILVSEPIYRADALMQVEEKGKNSISAFSQELAPLLGDSTTVAAELEILSSRMVLGRVVEKLHLNIEVQPYYIPLIGGAIARRHQGNSLSSPLMGLADFAWGGEELKVEAFEVPRSKLDEIFTIEITGEKSFKIIDVDGEIVLNGVIGVRTVEGPYSAFISRFVARLGTRFLIVRRSQEVSIVKLREALSVKERGKKSGVLEVSLQGAQSDNNARVLDEILKTYVRQNVERRSAEAENTLKFLETQLPRLKAELDSAEAAYNDYRQSRGSLDLSIETQSVLQSLVEVDNQIVALKQERDELRQSFTGEHPRVQAIDQRIERLRERRKQFDSDISRLPDTQQRVLQLARDVEVSTTLYTNLLNTAQQLRVSKAGTVGDVRIIDSALAQKKPVSLAAPVVLIIAGFLGLIISSGVIAIIRSLRVAVENPEEIEERLGLPVYATVPHSADEVKLATMRSSVKGGGGSLLAITNPEDDAIESLRELRASINFALLDASSNSILITGPSPGLGKSFISKNLGVVLAQSGGRVVLVDADMRKGHIHKEFGLARENGVSEYVRGGAEYEDIVKKTAVSNLWVVTSGVIPPNPSELLMHQRFEDLLDRLSKDFDTVIVDAPPVLAVSDAAIIGRHVGATLMVARSGRHPIRELEQAIKRLSHVGVHVKGFVFNDYYLDRQRFKYGSKGYVYRYSYTDGE